MKIEIRLNSPARHYRPGDMVEGEVVLRPSSAQQIERVEVDAVPMNDESRSISGKLAGEGTVESRTSYPLAIQLPRKGGSDDDGNWKINVAVRGEDDTWHASVPITVERSEGQRTGENIGLAAGMIFFALPFLAAGAAGLGFGIGGLPPKIIPIGVLWFAFVGGMLLLLVARAIMGGRERGRVMPVFALPVTLALVVLGVGGLYIFFLQPDLIPLKPVLHSGPLQSLLSLLDAPDARPRLMALLAAGFLLPTAAGVMLRRPVSPWLQFEIALATVSGTIALIVVGDVGFILASGGKVPHLAEELWVAALVGVISIATVFKRPTWTAAPAVTFAAGLVPTLAGVVGLYGSLRSGGANGGPEKIVAALVLLWGLVVFYRGTRNVLVTLFTAKVDVTLTPERVPIGGSVLVTVAIDPRRSVTLEEISGVLLCEKNYEYRSGTSNRRTDTQTVHRDARVLKLEEGLSSGNRVERELRFPIPVGLEMSNDSSTNGVYWSLDVKVAFAGSVDWAATFPVEVVSQYD